METGTMIFSLSEIGNLVYGDEASGRVIKIHNRLILTVRFVCKHYKRGRVRGQIFQELIKKFGDEEDISLIKKAG
jgi:hypothetical protein